MNAIMKSHIGIHFKLKEIENKGIALERAYSIIDNFRTREEQHYENNKKAVAVGMLLAEKIIIEIRSLHESIVEFIKDIKISKNRIEVYGKIAAEKKIYCAEKIIHEILRYN